MFKTVSRCLREYKKPMYLTFFFIALEAVIEAIIPFITAKLVNHVSAGVEMSFLLRTGLLLFVMTVISLACGGLAGFTCSKASAVLSSIARYVSCSSAS